MILGGCAIMQYSMKIYMRTQEHYVVLWNIMLASIEDISEYFSIIFAFKFFYFIYMCVLNSFIFVVTFSAINKVIYMILIVYYNFVK